MLIFLSPLFNPENEIGCHFDDCHSFFYYLQLFFLSLSRLSPRALQEETCEIRCKENLDLWQRLVANGFFSEILNLFCTLFALQRE
jgi:hypothetical protein